MINNFKRLIDITDEDLLAVANIAGIKGNVSITRSDSGIDRDCVEICDDKKRRLRLYFSGSNTRVTHGDIEVIEYCFEIYFYLYNKGYRWSTKF